MKGESRVLSRGRTAYWSDGTVVIRDLGAPDGGTTFRPAKGYNYFLRLDLCAANLNSATQMRSSSTSHVQSCSSSPEA